MTVDLYHDVNVVAVVRAAIIGHPDLAWVLPDPSYVSGDNEGPYPHLSIRQSPGGTDTDWITEDEILLTLYAEQAGDPGASEMRRMLKAITRVVYALPDAPYAGGPVVSQVRSSSPVREAPEPNGQPAWKTTMIVTLQPERTT